MKNFRTLHTAVEFYQATKGLALKGDAREQLDRAARSIALNLAEGRGKHTLKDQKRFFYIAFGSVRECQALLTLERLEGTTSWDILDKLAASIYRLIQQI